MLDDSGGDPKFEWCRFLWTPQTGGVKAGNPHRVKPPSRMFASPLLARKKAKASFLPSLEWRNSRQTNLRRQARGISPRAPRHDPHLGVWQRPLKLGGDLRGGCEPRAPFLRRAQQHRHGLRVDGADHAVGPAGEEREQPMLFLRAGRVSRPSCRACRSASAGCPRGAGRGNLITAAVLAGLYLRALSCSRA